MIQTLGAKKLHYINIKKNKVSHKDPISIIKDERQIWKTSKQLNLMTVSIEQPLQWSV